jgi:polysaccharide biosynthesis transport protein
MPQPEQLEASLNVSQYWQTTLHRKWWLIGGVFVGWLIVFTVSWIIPAKYESDALILIQRQQLSDKVVTPNVQIDLQQRLDTMTQRVLSRSNLTKTIQKFNLYAKDLKGKTIDEVVDEMRKDVRVELVLPDEAVQGASTRAVGNLKDMTGFTISYKGASPSIAQQVTQELTGLYIRENIDSTTEINKQATDFLQTQLEQAGKDLAEQEAKLRTFKTQYLGQLPEQLQSNLAILTGLQTRLQQANDALNRAQQQELYLQSLASQFQTMSDSGEVPNSAAASIDQRLTTMKAELADLKEKYTDKHPDVVHLEHDIAATEALKKQLSKDADENAAAAGGTQGVASLAQVKSQLKANEREISDRKKDVKEIESEIAQYQGRLNQTPVREQELANIERDHEQSLANYNSLLAKKQAADLASNLVSRSQGEQMQLLDPPSLPDQAVFPNHFKFSLAGIGVGLALGLLLVVGRELMAPAVYNEQQASSAINAPILTAVPSLATASERSQARRAAVLRAVAAVLVLTIIPVGTLMAYLHG